MIIDTVMFFAAIAASLALPYRHRSKKSVKAIIYTHSHVDHYGAVRSGVSEDDVKARNAKIYAPISFLKAAVAEKVMPCNAMSRRASYRCGNLLPSDTQDAAVRERSSTKWMSGLTTIRRGACNRGKSHSPDSRMNKPIL